MPVRMGQKISSAGLKLLLREALHLDSEHASYPDPALAVERALRKSRDLTFDSTLQQPYLLDSVLQQPTASRELQLQHAWNPDDRSLNIFIKDDDPFTVSFDV